LPLIRLGLDSPTHSLVDASIKCLPVVLPVLDFSTVKNEVFPPIASTFSRTSSLAIKVRSLEAFSVLCGGSADDSGGFEDDLTGAVKPSKTPKSSILDKYTIQEKLVPSLKAIKTKEPSVMMAALKVFRQVGKIADTDFLAIEVLPILWSFSLGPLLNLSQFNDFMALIKTLSTKIEKEQSRKLQELSSEEDSSGFQNGSNSLSQSTASLTSPDTGNARNNFERLVLGKNAAATNGNDMDLWGSVEPEHASKPPSVSFPWSNNGLSPGQGGASNQLGFRSITPDQKLSSFTSLQPVSQAAPTAPSFPTMQPASPTWGVHSPGTKPSPSLGSVSGIATNNPMPQPPSQRTPSYSAFSIPPPPGGIGSSNAMRSPSSGLNMNSVPSTHFQPQPQPSTQKSGLDKYESLL